MTPSDTKDRHRHKLSFPKQFKSLHGGSSTKTRVTGESIKGKDNFKAPSLSTSFENIASFLHI